VNETNKLLEFISFCLEMYAARGSISGREAMERFKRFGVVDYLEQNYEALHTQGFGWILPAIDDYISAQERA